MCVCEGVCVCVCCVCVRECVCGVCVCVCVCAFVCVCVSSSGVLDLKCCLFCFRVTLVSLSLVRGTVQ